ncbi:MAG: hypothetical protein C0412_05140 [Flavobacterium sp.]|nr:hypothetical protein [Flavobacterium sp.]
MKAGIFILVIILLVTSSISVQAQEPAAKEKSIVTYVANEGFMIETKNHKVLFDGIFGNIKGDWCDQPQDSVLNKILIGTAPFNNIDLVFVSHYHSDHFNRNMVVDFLKNNSKAVLVCPEQVNSALKKNSDYSIISGRINSIIPGKTFDTSMTINNVKIRAMRINHGSYFLKDSLSGEFVNIHKNVENLAYLIELDGFSFLHTGDGTPGDKKHFEDYKIKNIKTDITFLDRMFLNTQGIDIIKDFVKTRYLVYMHIEPANRKSYKAMRNYPDDKFKLFIFENMMDKLEIVK